MTEQTTASTMTLEEVEQELAGVGHAIAAHEQTIFHLITAANAIQGVLISKGLVTADEMQASMKAEAEKLAALYVKHLEKGNAVPEVPANDSGLILP